MEQCERWLPVVGYDGYEVSDLGQVKTFKLRPGIKAQMQTRSGHLTVGLVDPQSNKIVTRLVHQLVLEAFVGPCPPGMVTLHGDGDPSNNGLGNLRYGTHQENSRDRESHGRTARGEKHGKAKLTDALAAQILGERGSKKSLAKKYNVSRVTIRKIKNGQRKDAFRAAG